MKVRLVTLIAFALLAGCGFVSDTKLQYQYQSYMQECFGNRTNDCNNKAIDYNITFLESVKDQLVEKGIKDMNLSGEKAEQFEKHVSKSIDKLITAFDEKRPGFFSRWILGDAEPFDGKAVMIIGQEETKMILSGIMQDYARMVARSNMTLGDVWGDDPNFKASASVQASIEPEPELQPVTQSAQAPATAIASGPDMKSAADAAIGAHAEAGTAAEYVDARSYLTVDLDGNGSLDAVVMYTLEPTDGGNYSNQYMLPIIYNGIQWEVGGRLDVIGSGADMKDEGNGVVSYIVLTHGEDDPHCCPSVETKHYVKWNGSALQVHTPGDTPTASSKKPLSSPPYYSVLTMNNPNDDGEVQVKRALECSMASKLVGQMPSIDIISNRVNDIVKQLGIFVDAEIIGQYHASIKADWGLKEMTRIEQDEYLVGIYNSPHCRSLHQQRPITVAEVPSD